MYTRLLHIRKLMVLLLILSANLVLGSNLSEIDSLKSMLNNTMPDTSRINLLSKLTIALYEDQQAGEAENYLSEALVINKTKAFENSYYLKWALARRHIYKREILDGIEQIRSALKLIGPNGYQPDIAKMNNLYALLNLYAGRFAQALEAYHNNIDFIQEHKLNGILPATYFGLFQVHANLDQVEDQRKNLLLMIQSARDEDKMDQVARGYLLLGDIGMQKDSNFTYAIDNYNKSLKLKTRQQDTSLMVFLMLRIAWNHYLNGDLDSAQTRYLESLEYSIPRNNVRSITNAYGNLGTIFRDRENYDKALDYYSKSIEYSLDAKDWYNLSWLYKDIADMHVSNSDYKQAYDNLLKHKQFSDSLETMRYNRGLTEARTRFESDKATKELEVLTLKLDKQKYVTYGFAGLVALGIIIGILFFRQIRAKSKQRISEMNHKISELTQRNLRQQMNPHFIFNTLNSIQYYMYQHDKISTNNYLTKFSMLMRKTLENSQHTSIPIKDELDAVELYLQLETLRFKHKFDYSIEVDDDIDTLLLMIPTMLIQPYVENAISHGIINKDSKGSIQIKLGLTEKNLVCTIEDNGIGRKAAMKLKNKNNNNHNSLGTKITESRLNLVNSLYGVNLKTSYTDLYNDEGNPTGTRVVINIPIIT